MTLLKDIDLFQSKEGELINKSSLLRGLIEVGAQDAEVLFIHTGMSFGFPNMSLKRLTLLQELYDVINQLSVPTICFPTFTFSFCNKQDYDVKKSKSQMGALNEYVRTLPDAVRSIDPLMSIATVGKDMDLITSIGNESIGPCSTFDKLHKRQNVKFLFFGTTPGACMTYTHYVEKYLKVPYRYDRMFTGKITKVDGTTYEDTYTLFVRYNGVLPAYDNRLQEYLLQNGSLRKTTCGDGKIFSIREEDAFNFTKEQILRNPDYMLATPYKKDNVDKTFLVHDMVAL